MIMMMVSIYLIFQDKAQAQTDAALDARLSILI